jgi:hypothetical protein
MTPATLKERLKVSAFRPFRIVTSDGTTYDVRDRDLLMVGLGEIVVGIPSDQDASLFRATRLVSLRHVVRLEPLEEIAPTNN